MNTTSGVVWTGGNSRSPLTYLHLAAVALCLAAPATAPAAGSAENIPAHPRLFDEVRDLPSLRRKFNSPRFAAFRKVLLDEADRLMTYQGKNPQPGRDIGEGYRAYKLAAQQKKRVFPALAWAYVLTGEEKYRDLLLKVVPHVWKQPFQSGRFGSEFDLTRFGAPAAIAYDLLYEELNSRQRDAWGTWLDSFLNLREKPSYGWSNNIGAIYFSATGIVALTRLDDNAEARSVLTKCLTGLKPFYKASIVPHPDSGYPEGPLYRNYALFWLLSFVDAYENVTGRTDHGLLQPAFFENSPRYIQTLLGGDGVWATFNDTQPLNYGGPWSAYLGARRDQPLLRWFADRVLTDASSGEAGDLVHTFLWRDEEPGRFPGLPTVSMLPSLNIATLRSEGTPEPGMMLAVRGRGASEHGHNQPDTGSFVLYAGGESFLIDPGYYQGEAEKHNLLIVDGAAPQGRKKAPVTAGEDGEIRWAVVDATSSYEGTERVRRLFVMVDDRAVVLLDDVAGRKVTTRLQTAWKPQVQPDKRSAIIDGTESRLWIGTCGPKLSWSVTGPNDFGRSWIFRKLAADDRLSWHTMQADYAVDAEAPLVTVFMPLDAGTDSPSVTVQRADGRVTVGWPGKRTVIFRREDAGWRVEQGRAESRAVSGHGSRRIVVAQSGR